MVRRGKAICKVAVSASLLGVPIVGLPGPGHHDSAHAARGGVPVVASPSTPAPAAAAQRLSVHPDRGFGNGHGHDQGGSDTPAPWSPPGADASHNQWSPPSDSAPAAPTTLPAPPAPPAPAARHAHVAPTPSVPPIPAANTPTISTPAPVAAPNVASGEGSGTPGDPPVPTSGPGDAHNAAHANSNSGAPAASRQGQGNSGSTPCDGLCHGGQNPSLSSANAVVLPTVAVSSTPTPPVVVTPPTPSIPSTPTITPPTTPTPSPLTVTLPTVPGLPLIPKIGTPISLGAPLAVLGTGTGFGSIAGSIGGVSAPAPTTAATVTRAGAFANPASVTSATGGLGSIAALAPAAAAAPGSATGTTAAHHSGGSRHSGGGGGTTILEIPRFINHIPAGVWIALGGSLLVAALAAGAAVISRRRAAAQAGELAAVSAAALTDPLTGVLNRRGFIEAVERELARARRYHHPFVLAYVDVRGLKNVNDTEGHLTGDTLLKNVAALMTDCARAGDVVGRLGGDELGLLLAEQTPDAAKAVTRRIEHQVAVRRRQMNLGSHWDLTIGTAAFPQDGQSVDDLLGAADRRLYQQRGIQLVDSSR